MSRQTKLSRIEGRDSVLRLFGEVHNHIYANEGLSPIEALEEFVKLLFAKLTDEREGWKDPRFVITEQERRAIRQGKPNEFLKRIETLFESCRNSNPDIFSKDDSIGLKETTLAYVVDLMKDVKLTNSDHDIKALAFQKFIHEQQRGSRGQFLTPSPAVELGVSICQPVEGDSIIDPACGTASFLVQSYNLVGTGSERKPHLLLVGADINAGILRLARMNIALQGIESYSLHCVDSLIPWESLPEEMKPEAYDIVLTNPPFGSQGRITNPNILARYELGHKWNNVEGTWFKQKEVLDNQTPQILFLERCLDLLKPGGRMAIVLPESTLQNPSIGYVREFLRQRAYVLAILSMPQGTFIPYGTGIKASIVCLQKRKKGKTSPDSVFFADVEHIGYVGDKSATPDFRTDSHGNLIYNEKGNPILNEDLSEVKRRYAQFVSTGNINNDGKSFILETKALGDRLDCEFYKPVYTELEKQLKAVGSVPMASLVKIKRNKIGRLDGAASVKYVEISDVDSTNSEITGCSILPAHRLPSRASFELKTGDVITAVSGISTGTDAHASAIVTEEYDGAICTNGFAVLTAVEVDPYYLLSYLRTRYYTMQMRRYRVGSAIPDVSSEDLKKVLVPRFPEALESQISEQMRDSYGMRMTARNKLKVAMGLLEDHLPKVSS
jgi:type I restriction enzyme M protein